MNSVIHADADGSYYLVWNIFVVDTRAVLLRCTTEPPVCIATVEFAGDDTSRVSHAAARTGQDLISVTMSLLRCWSCRSQREYSTSCACLCTRCSLGMLPITWPACWRPPLTFLHGRRCIYWVYWLRTALCGGWCRRMVLRNRELHARNDDDGHTKNESEDWWQGFLCCRTLCLESAADRLETLAFDCFIQEQTEKLSFWCCLHREHCVNSGMRHRSDCKGRPTSRCCYCYCNRKTKLWLM